MLKCLSVPDGSAVAFVESIELTIFNYDYLDLGLDDSDIANGQDAFS